MAFFAFLLGLGTFLAFNLGAYAYYSEIVVLLAAPFALGRIPASRRCLMTLAKLMAAWLVFALITDFYRGSQGADMMKGAGRIIVLFAAVLVFRACIFTSVNRLYAARWYLFGASISAGLSVFIFPAGAMAALIEEGRVFEKDWEHFYVYFAYPCLLLAIAIVPKYAGRWVQRSFLGSAGVTIMYLGSRSLGAICLLTAMLIRFGTDRPKKLSLRPILAIAISLPLVYCTYVYSARNGYLGEKAQMKYLAQSGYEGGVLIAGRLDTVAGLYAVKDSPIIGHGSWALDTNGYMYSALSDFGDSMTYEGTVYIPSHSHIVGAWVDHGIAGFCCWLYVLWLIWIVFRQVGVAGDMSPLVLFLCIGMTWDIFFSPQGNRVFEGVVLAMFVAIADRKEDEIV